MQEYAPWIMAVATFMGFLAYAAVTALQRREAAKQKSDEPTSPPVPPKKTVSAREAQSAVNRIRFLAREQWGDATAELDAYIAQTEFPLELTPPEYHQLLNLLQNQAISCYWQSKQAMTAQEEAQWAAVGAQWDSIVKNIKREA